MVGFVRQASKTVVLFLCSLLQSSLQIFGQTDGLLEICVLRLAKQLCFCFAISFADSWANSWPARNFKQSSFLVPAVAWPGSTLAPLA